MLASLYISVIFHPLIVSQSEDEKGAVLELEPGTNYEEHMSV